jgi:hypothetical protein
MVPMAINIEAATSPTEHFHALPENMEDWSSGARNAYREVLGALDSWSSRQDASKSLNSWIAEEAVRQSW